MCGHIGVYAATGYLDSITTSQRSGYYNNDIYEKIRNYTKVGLLVDVLRGKDGTGLYVVPSKEEAAYSSKFQQKHHLSAPLLLKRNVPAWDFIDLVPVYTLLESPIDYFVSMGHNRSATIGKGSALAAHPYERDHIVLAHNGTLDPSWKYDLGEEVLDDAFTDSDGIAISMAKNGEIKTLESLFGAFALVWINNADRTLNFARNADRPFYYALSDDGSLLLWGSIPAMIEFSAKMSGIKCENIQSLKIGQHIKIKINQFAKINLDNSIEFKLNESFKASYGYHNSYENHQSKPIASPSSDRVIGVVPGDYILMTPSEFLGDRTSTVYENTSGNGNIAKKAYIGDLTFVGARNSTSPYIAKVRNVPSKLADEVMKEKYVLLRAISKYYTPIENKDCFAVIDCSYNMTYPVKQSIIDKWTRIKNGYFQFTTFTLAQMRSWQIEEKNTSLLSYYFTEEEFFQQKTKKEDEEALEYFGPSNTLLTKKEFTGLVKNGCLWCKMEINPDEEDGENIVWYGDNPVCPACVEDYQIHNGTALI